MNRYLQIDFLKKNLSKAQQAAVLKNAFQISNILGRILVFPMFACGTNDCNFVQLFGPCIRHFHEYPFLPFREHSFLNNPKVPEVVTDFPRNVTIFRDEMGPAITMSFKDYITIVTSEYRDHRVIRMNVTHALQLVFEDEIQRVLDLIFDRCEK